MLMYKSVTITINDKNTKVMKDRLQCLLEEKGNEGYKVALDFAIAYFEATCCEDGDPHLLRRCLPFPNLSDTHSKVVSTEEKYAASNEYRTGEWELLWV